MNDKTMTFSLGNEQEQEIRRVLTAVYDALKEKGYNLPDGIYTVEQAKEAIKAYIRGGDNYA